LEEISVKPKVVVSKCLEFESCRYNGVTIPDAFVQKLNPFVHFIPVCPEVEIGLGVPRDPVRIVEKKDKRYLHQPATGKDLTADMEHFSEQFLNELEPVDGFLLKNRSPSCGIHDTKIYHGFEKSAKSIRGKGFFGGKIIDLFEGYPIEDEGRLKNYILREQFLTTLYAFARLRRAEESEKINSLIEYHSSNKLLFMAHNQTAMRAMGQIVASYNKHNLAEVYNNYRKQLMRMFSTAPKANSMVNALQHMFGGFSEKVTSQERQYFLNTIEEYRDERVPVSVPIHLIRGWAVRFGIDYLLKQTILRPYPLELLEVSDSGKGRV
jgi:uncharacterized protein YbgA (DUF1722 family)/uncharacterized protein YbbK (DUF523 family)